MSTRSFLLILIVHCISRLSNVASEPVEHRAEYTLTMLQDMPEDSFSQFQQKKLAPQIKASYSKYGNEGTLFVNISHILFLLEPTHCHVIMDNYQNVDIESSYTGAILRRPQIAVFSHPKATNNWFHHIPFWAPFGMLQSNTSKVVQNGERFPCKLSKYWANYVFSERSHYVDPVEDVCFALNVSSYAWNTKPWNCQVHISIQITTPILKAMKHPLAFKLDTGAKATALRHHLEPSIAPRVHIFASHEDLPFDIEYHTQFMKSFLAAVFTVTIGKLRKGDTRSLLLGNRQKVVSMCRMAMYMKYLEDYKEYYPRLGCFEVPSIRHAYARSIAKEEETEMTINFRYEMEDTFLKLVRKLKYCDNRFASDHPSKQDFLREPMINPEGVFSSAVASLLFDIIGNVSIHIDQKVCKNGDLVSNWMTMKVFALDQQNAESLRLSYKEYTNSLAFVSCGGNRGSHSFGLMDLVTVYDVAVWICTLVTTFVLAEVNRQFSRNLTPNETFVTHVLNIFKLFLEQGDPFPVTFLRNRQLKITFLAVSFVGIVLSCGFKSSNLEKMIAPNYFLPYTKFTELVHDEFAIFCRSLKSRSLPYEQREYFLNWLNIPNPKLSRHSLVHLNASDYSWIAWSEVSQWKVFLDLMELSKDAILMIENHSSLDSNAENIFKDTLLSRNYQWPNISGNIFFAENTEAHELLMESESYGLWQHLLVCNKSALVLPTYMAHRYATRLFRSHPEFRINVGNEKYANVSIGFQFEGQFHSHFIKRMQGVIVSGIWDWWSDIIRETTKFTPILKDTSIKPPSITGNLSTIFLILVYGLLLSCLACVLECVVTLGRCSFKCSQQIDGYSTSTSGSYY